MGSDLELDTSVIHDSDKTYVSLLDKYKIDLFSNKQLEERMKYEKKKELKEKEVRNCVFLHTLHKNQQGMKKTEELFAQPMVIADQQEYAVSEGKLGFLITMGAIPVFIFAIIFTKYFSNRRKKNEMEDTDESGSDQAYD